MDLLSASPDEEFRWTHILKGGICFPLCIVFTADRNLGVGLRYVRGFFFLETSWMKRLNYHHLQDPARPIRLPEFTTSALIRFRSSRRGAPSNIVLNVVCATVGRWLV